MNGVWDEKTLFVDDEHELSPGGPHKGWGETIAGSFLGVGQLLADRLNSYTDR